MMPPIIDIEGIDGAGKSTQAKLLYDWVSSTGRKAQLVHFPAYETATGKAIKEMLDGLHDDSALQLLFVANRYEMLSELTATNTVTICDRYFLSGWAYSAAVGLPDDFALLLERLDGLLPEPDFIILLDLPVDVAMARLAGKADSYEANPGLLERAREEYRRLVVPSRIPHAVVDASGPVDSVFASGRLLLVRHVEPDKCEESVDRNVLRWECTLDLRLN